MTADEWGYTSLEEMEGVTVGGLGMERDRNFDPTPISKLAPQAVRTACKKQNKTVSKLTDRLAECMTENDMNTL